MRGIRDRKLVRRMLAGDQQAFNAFVDEYFPKLYRYALHRLRNHEDVEEVVQLALTSAARYIETFRGESTLLTWLIRICRHEISRQLKIQTRNDLVLPFLDDDILRAIVESIESGSDTDPEGMSRRHDLITLTQLALDQLPDNYALALELKYIEGYSSKEIAEEMQMGDSAVQSLLARARRAFREVCSEAALSLLDIEPRSRGTGGRT